MLLNFRRFFCEYGYFKVFFMNIPIVFPFLHNALEFLYKKLASTFKKIKFLGYKFRQNTVMHDEIRTMLNKNYA